MTYTQPFPTPCSVTSCWWSEIGLGGKNIYNSGNGKCFKSGFFIWIAISRISSGLHWFGSTPQTTDQALRQATHCFVISGELPAAETGVLLWRGHSYDYLRDWGENSQDLGHLLSLLRLTYHPHITAPPRNLSCSRLLPDALPVSHQLPDALLVSRQSGSAAPGRSHRMAPPPTPVSPPRAGVPPDHFLLLQASLLWVYVLFLLKKQSLSGLFCLDRTLVQGQTWWPDRPKALIDPASSHLSGLWVLTPSPYLPDKGQDTSLKAPSFGPHSILGLECLPPLFLRKYEDSVARSVQPSWALWRSSVTPPHPIQAPFH